jgi:hypothetical protein
MEFDGGLYRGYAEALALLCPDQKSPCGPFTIL